jgi:hypothetical protein|mmetsp:Transcript_74820/g.117047  ORF Transcript_74820/g.117047 Transcript_74820/m.117047 type:complete len:464 (-) Transcript_74820:144-1535(-)
MAEVEGATAPVVENTAAATEKKSGGKDAISAQDRESARQTFLTSTGIAETTKSRRTKSENKFPALQATTAGPRIKEHHEELTRFAHELTERMDCLMTEHEKDFFLAYKTHMYKVQGEIKMLRMKADREDERTREDTKIRALEGELDWFMTEALRLDELCKGYKKEVDKWKAKADALDEDRRFLEDQIKGAKRQNKILRAAAERARSSAYSALMVTKAKSEALDNGANTGNGPFALTAPPTEATRKRPASADAKKTAAGNGSAARRALEAERSKTPDAQVTMLPQSASTSSLQMIASKDSTEMKGPPELQVQKAAVTEMLGLFESRSPPSRTGVLGTEAEERYIEAISRLKESIVSEQHTVRMLQAARATAYSKKSELEEFFLKCIDEARKDLMRKRHMTMQKDRSERERVLEAVLSNEDVLVCLYEKLFPHRTGIARSLGGDDGSAEAKRLAQLPMEELIDPI